MWRAGVSRIKWLDALSAISGGILMAKRASLLLALSWAALFLMPSAAAQTEVPVSGVISESVTIAASEWRAYRVSLGSQDSFQFSVRVSQGSDIDVYTMPASGYAQYTDPSAPSFGYLTSGTQENTQSFGTSVSPSSGTYYLVVDNIAVSSSGAPGSAPVTVDVSAQIRPFPILGVVIGVVAVLAIIVAVLLVVRSRRKKKAAMRMMPPPGLPPMEPPQPPLRPPGG